MPDSIRSAIPLPDWEYTTWQAQQAEEQARRQRRDAEMAA